MGTGYVGFGMVCLYIGRPTYNSHHFYTRHLFKIFNSVGAYTFTLYKGLIYVTTNLQSSI